MKHSMIKKTGYLLTAVLFLFCCTSEKESFWRDVEKEEIQSFFKFESSQSRTESFTTDLIQVVINTLCKQGDLLDAVRTYRSKYGIPMWEHSVGISVENGYQLFVPVHKKDSQAEIQTIWHFGIYDNKLYHFTLNRNPQSNIIEEYWKFDYFTIYALRKKPSSGLYFKDVALSRSAFNCQYAYVGMEMNGEYEEIIVDVKCFNVDDSQFLNDGESGGGGGGLGNGGFPSDVPIDNGSSPGLPPGGTGGNGSVPSLAPKAQAIFRNSKMIDENWQVIENMIEKIIEDCMGQNLYNGLKQKLNGKTLTIQFQNDKGSSFNYRTGAIKLSAINMESNHLFHEMFHAYQAYQETPETYSNSVINLEIEAHYAQYLYLKKLPEYPGSKWSIEWAEEGRPTLTTSLEFYITHKGELIDDKDGTRLNVHLNKLINAFKKDSVYSGYNYDGSRQGLSNFQTLQILTKGC